MLGMTGGCTASCLAISMLPPILGLAMDVLLLLAAIPALVGGWYDRPKVR